MLERHQSSRTANTEANIASPSIRVSNLFNIPYGNHVCIYHFYFRKLFRIGGEFRLSVVLRLGFHVSYAMVHGSEHWNIFRYYKWEDRVSPHRSLCSCAPLSPVKLFIPGQTRSVTGACETVWQRDTECYSYVTQQRNTARARLSPLTQNSPLPHMPPLAPTTPLHHYTTYHPGPAQPSKQTQFASCPPTASHCQPTRQFHTHFKKPPLAGNTWTECSKRNCIE